MFEIESYPKKIRMMRLFRREEERIFIVPLDHGVTIGPIGEAAETAALVRTIAEYGADAVVLHKGRARFIDPACFRKLSLIIHISAGTIHASDVNAKTIVAGVEECIRLGADAISIHVNMGSATESKQLFDLAHTAEACSRWNMPLMAMIYPRGPQISNPYDPALVSHAVNLAAELGADIVKTVYTGSVDTMNQVVRACPIPVLAAGGSKKTGPAETAMFTRDVLRSGAKGLAMGRNIFEADNPVETIKAVAHVFNDTKELIELDWR